MFGGCLHKCQRSFPSWSSPPVEGARTNHTMGQHVSTVNTQYDGDHDSFIDMVKFALFGVSVRRTQKKHSWKTEIGQFMKDLKNDLLKVLSDTITDFIHEYKQSNACYNRRVPSRALRRSFF